jgi:flagellar biosynthesis/type III secretory pathway protein FliH
MPLSETRRQPVRWRIESLLERDAASQAFRPLWNEVPGQGTFEAEDYERRSSARAGVADARPDPARERFIAETDLVTATIESGRPVLAGPGETPAMLEDSPAALPPSVAAPDSRLLERERETARAEGHAAGYAEGRAAALAELQADLEAERARLADLFNGLQASIVPTDAFFAPLERLSLHLARQLVRGELTLSGQAISRLIENCLAEIDPRSGAVTVRLNPLDLECLERMPGRLDASISLVRDPHLSQGSVRAEMAEALVEDLIEHRLDSLSRSLLGEPWAPPRGFEPITLEAHDAG